MSKDSAKTTSALEKALKAALNPAWEIFVRYYKDLSKGDRAQYRTFAKNVSEFETKGKYPIPTRIAEALELSGLVTIEAEISVDYSLLTDLNS